MIKTHDDYIKTIQFFDSNESQKNTANKFLICGNTVRFLENGVLHIVRINEREYIIDKNTIIFSHKFNKPLEKYSNIMKHISVMIFTDENMYDLTSRFNRPVFVTKKMRKLSFGCSLNSLITLSKNVTHMKLGHEYNIFIVLSKNMSHLTMGYCYNQIILLTKNMTHLTMGPRYDQFIILTKNMTHLTLGIRPTKNINWTKNLTHLTLETIYVTLELSQQITHLTVKYFVPNLFDNLSNNIKEINFGYDTDVQITNVPNTIKQIPIEHHGVTYLHCSKRLDEAKNKRKVINMIDMC